MHRVGLKQPDWLKPAADSFSGLLASALQRGVVRPYEFGARFPNHSQRSAKEQESDANADDDVWPERLEFGDQARGEENNAVGDEVVA